MSETPAGNNLLYLVEAYCNGTITDAEFAELEQRLLQDAAARAFYRRYLNVHSALSGRGETIASTYHFEQHAATVPAKGPERRWLRRSVSLAVAAALLLAATMIYFLWNPAPERPQTSPLALENSSGNVLVTSGAGKVRASKDGIPIQAGDTIRTQDALSSAVVDLHDGTRLSLSGNTTVTFSESDHKSLELHDGTLLASVTPQKAGPLVILTPRDRVEVLGTKFSLTATAHASEVAVSEGRVRLTRLSDGKSVEVAAGQRAVSDAEAVAVVKDRLALPDDWSEDFEKGLPKGWEAGEFVVKDLPPGSRGAVQAVRSVQPDGAIYSLATQSAWANGLFAAHQDTHLHITFQMKEPRWFNVFISTREASGAAPAFASNYVFNNVPWEKARPGSWQTLSIPLSKFRRLSPPKKEAFEGELPFQVFFSFDQPDRGLVIDRIWVSRGGPDQVEIMPIE